MGKGDKKSRRGKINNKSYGARRPRKIKKQPSVEEKINIKGKV
jgi:30S ribosomal protein S31